MNNQLLTRCEAYNVISLSFSRKSADEYVCLRPTNSLYSLQYFSHSRLAVTDYRRVALCCCRGMDSHYHGTISPT